MTLPHPTHARPLLLIPRDHGGHAAPVDGARWPRTGDPAAEPHEPIDAVSGPLGRMLRVGFDWQNASPASNRNYRMRAS